MRVEIMGDRASVAEPGQLASAIARLADSDISVSTVSLPSDADVLVYSRRVEDTLDAANEYCQYKNVPLVIMSTGMDEAMPTTPGYPLVMAPNTGLRVLRFLQRVEEQAKHLQGWEKHIIEHHQPSKKDVSGTAKKLAEMLGLGKDEIVSVRNFEESRAHYPSMTEENVKSYAGHEVTFTNPANGDQESSDILVLGREEYAKGLVVICKILQLPEVKDYIAKHDNKVHIVDLLEAGFLG